MMAKIVKSAYVKFGVRKTNKVISVIASACAVVTVVAAIGMAYDAGHINGSQEVSDWFLDHGAELYEKDKEDDCNE